MGRGLWVTDIDPLCTKTVITTNLEPEADEAVVIAVSHQFCIFYVARIALFVKVQY